MNFRDLIAVIADSNSIKVFDCRTYECLYENSDSQNFVRDCAWLSSTELVTVGFEGKLRYHFKRNNDITIIKV